MANNGLIGKQLYDTLNQKMKFGHGLKGRRSRETTGTYSNRRKRCLENARLARQKLNEQRNVPQQEEEPMGLAPNIQEPPIQDTPEVGNISHEPPNTPPSPPPPLITTSAPSASLDAVDASSVSLDDVDAPIASLDAVDAP